MDNVQRPNEEDAGFIGGVRGDGQVVHLLVDFAFPGNSTPQQFRRNLSSKNEVVVTKVAYTDDQAEPLVPHGDNRLVAENYRFASVPRPGKLGKDEADHESLNDASED